MLKQSPPYDLQSVQVDTRNTNTAKQFNNTVNPALHCELDFGIDGKTREVVLSIQFSHLAATCQRIAKEANVVSTELQLIVKNEGGGSPDSDLLGHDGCCILVGKKYISVKG